MEELLTYLKGKKTYILVALYCVFVMIDGAEPAGFGGMLADVDAEKIQTMLMGLMVASGKAAWERFASRK